MSATRGEYKRYPTIQLEDDTATDERNRLKISFGVRKVKLILAHIEDLQQFVEDNENGGGQ